MNSQQAPPPRYSDLSQEPNNSGLEFQPNEKVKLYENQSERRLFSELEDFYAIIIATEHLESAFINDLISKDEYNQACSKLIAQFKSQENALLSSKRIESTADFMRKYSLNCPKAEIRLLKEGVPATVIYAMPKGPQNSGLGVAQVTQAFITAMDNVKLGLNAVDELQPLVADLMSYLNNSGIPKEFEAANFVKKWLVKLNEMRAVETLSEDDCRGLLFDLQKGYDTYVRWLQTQASGR